MYCYGLLGYPLGHSFSKGYFEGRLDYRNFEYDDVAQFLRERPVNLGGFNVTIPHKQAIIPFLDALSDEAREIGAVNCVKIDDGKLIGFNTDCYGFEISLRNFVDGNVKRAVVLGNGGASQAVQFVLRKLNIEMIVVSRNGLVDYNNLNGRILINSQLVVNTTSLGMSPNIDTFPLIDYSLLTKNHYLYDLVYNPLESQFLCYGRKQGCFTKNGLEMLHLQADKSLEIWTL